MPYFKSNQCSLYYTISGVGVPVVLISGLAANHRSWGLQVVDLKKYFQLITIDNRGIGKSKGTLDGLTIEDMAVDVGELLSMLNVERVHLIGFSMGGMIALEYAAKNPEKVCSLVLSSLPILENLGPFDAFASELNSVLCDGESNHLFQTLAAMFFSSNFLKCKQYEILADFFEENPNIYRPETISWQIHAIHKWLNLKKWTIGCTCPCMLIYGSEDKLVNLRTASDYMSEYFPCAMKKIIRGVGHAVHIEEPNHFNKIVCDFIQNHTI